MRWQSCVHLYHQRLQGVRWQSCVHLYHQRLPELLGDPDPINGALETANDSLADFLATDEDASDETAADTRW